MDNEKLRQEWAEIGDVHAADAIEMPPVDVQRLYHSSMQKRLIYNNIVELIINVVGIPISALFLYTFDTGGTMPTFLLWFAFGASIASVIPSILLFRAIHYPDPSRSIVNYLRFLLSRIQFYKVYQVSVAFAYCMALCVLGFLSSTGYTFLDKGNGQITTGILNFPEPYRTEALFMVLGISLLLSAFAAGMGYAMYLIFYNNRRKELKKRLESLLEE